MQKKNIILKIGIHIRNKFYISIRNCLEFLSKMDIQYNIKKKREKL